jgi:hypothetical protein
MTRTATCRPTPARRSMGRYRLIGVTTAMLVVCGMQSGVALAGPSYTVKVKVPASVVKSHRFTVTAYGVSSNLSHLTVFLTDGGCGSSAHREKVLGGLAIISANVVNHYSKSATRKAKFVGMHAACAYLTSVSPTAVITYAHAKALYTIHL